MKYYERNRNIRYAIFRDLNLNQTLNVLLNRTRPNFPVLFCDRFSKLERIFSFFNSLFFYIFGRFIKTKCRTLNGENGSKMF